MRGLIGQNCWHQFRLFEPIYLYNFVLGLEFWSQYISVSVSVSMAFHRSAASKDLKTRQEVCVTVQKIAGCMCRNPDNWRFGVKVCVSIRTIVMEVLLTILVLNKMPWYSRTTQSFQLPVASQKIHVIDASKQGPPKTLSSMASP